MKLQFLLFLTFFYLTVKGQNVDSISCFETKQLNYTQLYNNQIQEILAYANIKDTNFVCYQDTLLNSDTARIAYKINTNNHWISFPTSFKNPALEYRMVDIDNNGQPEIVIEGNIIGEKWPRGESINNATFIFQIDSIPTQIFKICNSCSVSNLGGKYADQPIDFSIKREIIIKTGWFEITELNTKTLSVDDNDTFRKFCYLTDIQSGLYKLSNGRFTKIKTCQ